MTKAYEGLVSQLRTAFRREPITSRHSDNLIPFSGQRHVHAVLASIWRARREVQWP